MFASHTVPPRHDDAPTATRVPAVPLAAASRGFGRRSALAAVGTVAALALTLSACGSSGGSGSGDSATPGMHHGPATTSSSGAGEGAGPFNAADVAFAQQMIPHHQQALEMARLAEGRAADAEVKDLATAIEKAQDPEIDTMKGWLKAWGKPLPSSPHSSPSASSSASPSASSSMGDMPGMNHGSGAGSAMPGMMSDQDMRDLAAAKGKDFDRKFSQLMIGHHQGAVAMAKDEQKNGDNADAKRLAGNVIAAQNAEIEQMNKIVARLK
ncbi:DUF305 domain-containing protein [Streptomyces sp. NBC_00083]|uniref:DUF305 domain-containing protein n=1 Tax=Streptomyces sp. NBC_00083 TaxID=2975647 RepID=UPI0022567425|nr:DUF305 domain-containing protein [Streptomyces sp. NBC_00083]MCX5384094.1 DUF305 domain-containing protein [Streptomyces sp. NBC_00083]